MPIDTLLFDLDGTLVDQFQPGSTLQFAWLVVRRFSGLAGPLTTWNAGWEAVHALQHHQSDATNFEAMIAAFAARAGVPAADVRERVHDLAAHDFARMGWRFRPVPGAREAIDTARARGFRLVLATNPTVPWPMTLHRLAWAGLAEVDWEYVTRPDAMTRTKPDVAYYHELLGKLERGPERCLMVGNDFRKDLPAMQAGIQTFLLDRPLSRKARRALATYQPDHFGSYADLTRLIARLASELANHDAGTEADSTREPH